ncbi:Nucleotide-binding universal stress protein, UspA family [Cryobacterium flavum]|uniref:Universal stress protein n=1 Tax=Cryobacterium flavum TaxID=1424659 RepID=A0A4R8UXY7_9MICO|nr:universal stress protein [Cryobacterium flavum]TFB74417.1 universal stress protein [Cryobacterium flavum]SDN15241.1 Nucleotide-binding universal stress protein, UspA family [Cryobacterium flavum]
MRFLVGYTATSAGADALALGVRLARAPGAELDIVLVLNAGERATLTPTDPGYDRLLLETAEVWLAEALTLVPEGISVHTHLEHADSFTRGLLKAAERLQANLIVVGAATHGLLGRFAIGSVAGGLLHSSHVPVALAPEGSRVMGTDEPIGRVTCAVGTKPGADGLLTAGIRLARTVDAPLRLVSLVAIDRPGADAQTIQLAADHAQAVLDYATEHLMDGLEVTASVASGGSIEHAVRGLHWDPAEVCIVGSSRLAQPHRLFLGSIAAKMLRELPVPLIVVPRDFTETVGK